MLYFISIIFWGEENLSMFSSNLFKKTIIMTIIVTLGSYFLPAVIKPSVSGYSVLSGTVSADPGLYLAQVIDQHDKIRNNGWIEAW